MATNQANYVLLAKNAHDVINQEHCNFKPGFDFDTSRGLPSLVSSRFQYQHKSTEAQKEHVKPLQTDNLPDTLQELLEHIFPLEIHSRLRDNQYQCVASLATTPPRQCTKGRPSIPDWICKKLYSCNTDVTYSELLNHIGSLVQAVMCALHQTTVLSSPSIAKIQELGSKQSHLSKEDCLCLQMWIRSCRPKWSEEVSVSEALREIVMRPLKPQDHTDGFLYILCDDGCTGKVKIGCTQNIARRLREWNTKCKRNHRLSSSLGQHIKIPHYRHVERLIFTELKDFQIRDPCEGCGCLHFEWFAVEEGFAVKLLQKWQNWVAQKPYAPCDSSDQWRVRPEMLDILPQYLSIS